MSMDKATAYEEIAEKIVELGIKAQLGMRFELLSCSSDAQRVLEV